MKGGLEGHRREEASILGGLFTLALLLRGWDLGLRPAAPMEAAQAWAAWRGEALPVGGSPLLAGWNATVFTIFGPDEGWMRSGAALAGALTVVALWWILRPMSLAGAIGAAGLWAISPTALMASRFLDGGIVAAAALAAALALWRIPHPRRWVGLAIALGIGAAAGPAFWTGCLMLLPLLGLDPPEAAFPRWKTLGLFGLTALLMGTWGGWRGSGAQETVESLSAWLAGFAPEGLPMWWAVMPAFLRGELLILALGLAGGVRAFRREDRFGTALMIAAGIGTGLQLLRFNVPFTEHAVTLVPWVALAGFTAQWVWEAAESVWRLQRTAVLGAAGIGGIGLGTIAAFMNLQGGMEEARWLVLIGVLGLLGFGIWIFGGLFEAERGKGLMAREEAGGKMISTLRNPAALGLIGVIVVALGLVQAAGAAALTRQADPVPGWSFPEMAAPLVRTMVETLRKEALRPREWPGELSVVVVTEEEEEEAFWRWTLRAFQVILRRRPPAPEIGEVWLTPEDMSVPLEPEQWVGHSFPAVVDQRGAEPLERRIVLWVRIP